MVKQIIVLLKHKKGNPERASLMGLFLILTLFLKRSWTILPQDITALNIGKSDQESFSHGTLKHMGHYFIKTSWLDNKNMYSTATDNTEEN